MEFWQILIIVITGVMGLVGGVQAVYKSKNKNSSYSHCYKIYSPFGAFVWADMLVFGFFWVVVSIVTILLADWVLFLLVVSVFWLVRSLGETIYWFLQQFTPRGGNQPEKFLIHRIVKNDSVYFVNQIYWQCITVITIITSLFLGKLWLFL